MVIFKGASNSLTRLLWNFFGENQLLIIFAKEVCHSCCDSDSDIHLWQRIYNLFEIKKSFTVRITLGLLQVGHDSPTYFIFHQGSRSVSKPCQTSLKLSKRLQFLTSSIIRSSHRRCSVKKGVRRNIAKFTGKHLCQRLFFNKVAGPIIRYHGYFYRISFHHRT